MWRNDTLAAMNRPLRIVAVLYIALFCAGLSYSNADNGTNKSVEALFSRAKVLENLTAADTPPYLLRIRVVGVGQLGASPQGTYTLRFLSPSQFRQDRASRSRRRAPMAMPRECGPRERPPLRCSKTRSWRPRLIHMTILRRTATLRRLSSCTRTATR